MLGYPHFGATPPRPTSRPEILKPLVVDAGFQGELLGMIGIAMVHPQKESKRLQFSWRSLFFDRAKCELS
jgi:hypothetical protein